MQIHQDGALQAGLKNTLDCSVTGSHLPRYSTREDMNRKHHVSYTHSLTNCMTVSLDFSQLFSDYSNQ